MADERQLNLLKLQLKEKDLEISKMTVRYQEKELEFLKERTKDKEIIGEFADQIQQLKTKLEESENRNLDLLSQIEENQNEITLLQKNYKKMMAQLKDSSEVQKNQQAFDDIQNQQLESKIVLTMKLQNVLSCESSEPIYSVKSKIEAKIKEIVLNNSQLIFADKQLEKGWRTLSYHNIPKDSTLHMALNLGDGMWIFIQRISDRIFALKVDPYETVKKVKDKIKIKDGIPPEHQQLIFNSTILEDDRILASYKIKHDSTLNLFMKLAN